MVKDGKDCYGLQTTNLKSLANLLKPLNRDLAPLITDFFITGFLYVLVLTCLHTRSDMLQEPVFNEGMNGVNRLATKG